VLSAVSFLLPSYTPYMEVMERAGWRTRTCDNVGLTPPSAKTRTVNAVFDCSCFRAEVHLGSPTTVECGSKVLGGCGFLHGESHIFLASCDCRGVSLRPVCPSSIGRGASSERERRTLCNITPNPGLDIKFTPQRCSNTSRGRGNDQGGDTPKTAFFSHQMRTECWPIFSMVFLMIATDAHASTRR